MVVCYVVVVVVKNNNTTSSSSLLLILAAAAVDQTSKLLLSFLKGFWGLGGVTGSQRTLVCISQFEKASKKASVAVGQRG